MVAHVLNLVNQVVEGRLLLLLRFDIRQLGLHDGKHIRRLEGESDDQNAPLVSLEHDRVFLVGDLILVLVEQILDVDFASAAAAVAAVVLVVDEDFQELVESEVHVGRDLEAELLVPHRVRASVCHHLARPLLASQRQIGEKISLAEPESLIPSDAFRLLQPDDQLSRSRHFEVESLSSTVFDRSEFFYPRIVLTGFLAPQLVSFLRLNRPERE
ncbi:hypothetical protein Mapa_000263 [Marchantia paleacea]|nr:hypothetical protein Mapa_000263 [Marchantia paleacea]